MPEEDIGKVTHFFDKISVAALELTGGLKVGDKIRIEARVPFVQEIKSMQVNHKDVKEAKAGDEIGLKTEKECKDGDAVVKLTDQ